jgi:hypothetical protein
MKDPHCRLRSVSKSFWSFLNSPDIQQAFTFTTGDWTPESTGSPGSKVRSDGFVDAFMDLVSYINTCPPGTQVTVEWNKNLPRYVSNGESQVFKAFTDLPRDLPFAYGSLTASRTTLRPWLGPKNTSAFHVPGMEFFATTGEYKNETEWRNPADAWFRQIIPKEDQLPKFLDELEKICNDLAEDHDLPSEDIVEDDSLDGRITLSHKGVHFAETQYAYGWVATGFKEDELVTDLTQAIQSTELLHILIPCNSATHKVITAGESGECADQMHSACNSNISSATAGSAAGQAANIVVCAEEPAYCDLLNAQAQAPVIQAANLVEEASCFRRATDSTESLDDIAPAAVSSPWRPASLPFSFFETPYKFTGRWFRSDNTAGHSERTFARHQSYFYGSKARAFLRSPRPHATRSPPAIPAGCGGRPWRLFQRPIPGARHSGCFIARCFSAALSFLTGPRQGPGYILAARIYGRACVLPQRPSSSSRRSAPNFSFGLSFPVVACVYGGAFDLF